MKAYINIILSAVAAGLVTGSATYAASAHGLAAFVAGLGSVGTSLVQQLRGNPLKKE